jgi:GTP cyclohydrolase II
MEKTVTNSLTQGERVRMPLEGAEDAQAVPFTDAAGQTHLALLFGALAQDAPLVRVHSSCVTGDALGSLRCDCGAQLRAAIARMAAEGGVLLYLQQEGRGIGLHQKLAAYHLQERGMDTVEANEALGFAPDERDYAIAARMLEALGVSAVRLLTNNPKKCEALAAEGIAVRERVALTVAANAHNVAYLDAKAKKLGHVF